MKSQVVAFALAAALVALPATGADEQVSISLVVDGVPVIDIKRANPRRSATLAKHAALLSAFDAACNAPRGEASQGALKGSRSNWAKTTG